MVKNDREFRPIILTRMLLRSLVAVQTPLSHLRLTAENLGKRLQSGLTANETLSFS